MSGKNFANGPEIPMGLGMALAQNSQAMDYFSRLTPEQGRQIIEQTHLIQSKEQMRSYVQQLASQGLT